jgi:uncharacterized protein YbbC (DUF1343 family)
MKKKIIITLFLTLLFSVMYSQNEVITGAERMEEYLEGLKNKKVALLTNQTGVVRNSEGKLVHLLDTLLSHKIDIVKVFSPEHGFRGNVEAGGVVKNSIDSKTGLPIVSLYGKNKKPTREQMQDFQILLFDLQDVGLRYYTYLTTMVKMMEACATHNVHMIILDRPNPNGHYVDGPILDMKYRSAVGYLPVPVVHGMTLGEIAHMVNGEGWLPDSAQCNITVVTCENYTHQTLYQLPTAPSPNLPNMRSIYLYPAMCYFEATPVSLGRGTDYPFQCYGHPNMLGYDYSFTPTSRFGAKTPPQQDLKCWGVDLSVEPSLDTIFSRGVDLTYLIDAYNNLHLGDHFFRPFFEKLIGVDWVRKMIKSGKTADEIRVMWKDDVAKFRQKRAKYLLYAE